MTNNLQGEGALVHVEISSLLKSEAPSYLLLHWENFQACPEVTVSLKMQLVAIGPLLQWELAYSFWFRWWKFSYFKAFDEQRASRGNRTSSVGKFDSLTSRLFTAGRGGSFQDSSPPLRLLPTSVAHSHSRNGDSRGPCGKAAICNTHRAERPLLLPSTHKTRNLMGPLGLALRYLEGIKHVPLSKRADE